MQLWRRGQPDGWQPNPAEQAVVDAAQHLAETLTALRSAHPIAFIRLWTAHCPKCGREMDRLSRGAWQCRPCDLLQRNTDPKHADCRTSQRAVLLELGEIATLVTGSNRAGKTYLGCLLAVLWLYGGDHWAVQCFLQLNGLPPDLVPARDNLVWYSSLSNELNVARQRGAFDALLPPSAVKSRWEQKGAFAEVSMPETGGHLYFKANDQGWKKYQGEHVDLVVLDEEHKKRVFQECLARTGEEHGRSGRTVLTMTPDGRGYVYKEFVVEKASGHQPHPHRLPRQPPRRHRLPRRPLLPDGPRDPRCQDVRPVHRTRRAPSSPTSTAPSTSRRWRRGPLKRLEAVGAARGDRLRDAEPVLLPAPGGASEGEAGASSTGSTTGRTGS